MAIGANQQLISPLTVRVPPSRTATDQQRRLNDVRQERDFQTPGFAPHVPASTRQHSVILPTPPSTQVFGSSDNRRDAAPQRHGKTSQ